MRARVAAPILLLAVTAGCGRGGAPGLAASGPIAGTIAFRNRMTAPAGYAELEVAGAKTVLPVLSIDSAASVDFSAPRGTPVILKWQGRDGIRTDTIGIVGVLATEATEVALTDVGIIKVGKAAD